VSKHLLEVFMTLNSDFAQLQPPPMLEGLAQETLTELLWRPILQFRELQDCSFHFLWWTFHTMENHLIVNSTAPSLYLHCLPRTYAELVNSVLSLFTPPPELAASGRSYKI